MLRLAGTDDRFKPGDERPRLWLDVDLFSVALDGMDPFKLPPPYDSWPSETITWRDAWNVQSVRKGVFGELILKTCPRREGHLPPKLSSIRFTYAGDDCAERLMEAERMVPESRGKRIVKLEICVRSFGIPRQRFIDGVIPAGDLEPWHRDRKRNGSSHYIGTVDDEINACLYRPEERIEELRMEWREKFPHAQRLAPGAFGAPGATPWLRMMDLEVVGVIEELLGRGWKVIDAELEMMILVGAEDLRARLYGARRRSEILEFGGDPERQDSGPDLYSDPGIEAGISPGGDPVGGGEDPEEQDSGSEEDADPEVQETLSRGGDRPASTSSSVQGVGEADPVGWWVPPICPRCAGKLESNGTGRRRCRDRKGCGWSTRKTVPGGEPFGSPPAGHHG